MDVNPIAVDDRRRRSVAVLGSSAAPSCASRNTSTLTTSRPVWMSKASARSERRAVRSTAVVNQTRPPATTGDDHPDPGTGVFHSTLRDSLHSSGMPARRVALAGRAAEL